MRSSLNRLLRLMLAKLYVSLDNSVRWNKPREYVSSAHPTLIEHLTVHSATRLHRERGPLYNGDEKSPARGHLHCCKFRKRLRSAARDDDEYSPSASRVPIASARSSSLTIAERITSLTLEPGPAAGPVPSRVCRTSEVCCTMSHCQDIPKAH